MKERRKEREAMSDLSHKDCVPCKAGTAPLSGEEIKSFIGRIAGWEVVENHHLHKDFRFPDFRSALNFVDRIGEIAEREGHHPDLSLSWGRVGVTLFTHAIKGLHENDFILAAKIDAAFALG
jgi:4a-hydroxytetrahydrobiopterin dehydratase